MTQELLTALQELHNEVQETAKAVQGQQTRLSLSAHRIRIQVQATTVQDMLLAYTPDIKE